MHTGGGHDLLRVTVVLRNADPRRIAAARLLAGSGPGRVSLEALPSAGDRQTVTTIGFAVPRTLRGAPLALQLAGMATQLPSPAMRELQAPAVTDLLHAETRALELATEASRAESARLELQAQLRRSRLQLDIAQAELQAAREAAEREVTPAAPTADPQAPVQPPREPLRLPARRIALPALACALIGAALIPTLLTGGSKPGTVAAPARAATVTRGVGVAQRLGIPARYLALYRTAGRRYGLDWVLLAAVGDIETEHGSAALPGVTTGANAAGASGPAQFLAGTWDRYGIDGDGDGRRDAHNPADAIPAMAGYLRASGAPLDWRGALLQYNHSAAYADAVLQRAAQYRRLLAR